MTLCTPAISLNKAEYQSPSIIHCKKFNNNNHTSEHFEGCVFQKYLQDVFGPNASTLFQVNRMPVTQRGDQKLEKTSLQTVYISSSSHQKRVECLVP